MIDMNKKVDEFKKNLILETAHDYFRKYGYEKTKIEQISKELGIGVGKIYEYFNSKERLFIAYLEFTINNALKEIKEHCEKSVSPVEKLRTIVEYKIQYFEKNKTTIKGYMENNQLFLRGISRRKEHPMAKVYEYSAGIIRQIKPVSDDEAYLLSSIFDGIINSYIECSSEEADLTSKTDEIMEKILKLIGV